MDFLVVSSRKTTKHPKNRLFHVYLLREVNKLLFIKIVLLLVELKHLRIYLGIEVNWGQMIASPPGPEFLKMSPETLHYISKIWKKLLGPVTWPNPAPPPPRPQCENKYYII